ncbi:hypothetical protein GCM10010464_20990 [Pseudonocardia yunnanensis]
MYGGCGIDGIGARIAQRLLALTAAIWHDSAAAGLSPAPDRLTALTKFGLTGLRVGNPASRLRPHRTAWRGAGIVGARD